MCQLVVMRVHISLDDDLGAELDRRVGRRRRSAFIAATVRHALDEEQRWERIEASLRTIADAGHDGTATPPPGCGPSGEVTGTGCADVRDEDYAVQGVTLSQADCLVAAAVTVGACLATGNPRDFPMAELTVEHWPVA